MRSRFKIYIALFSLVFVFKSAMAYNIYNNTDRDLTIVDMKDAGISTTIPAHGKASCNPTANGCSGNMYIRVFSTRALSKPLCRWFGKIKGRGNYFVINKNTSCPETNWCQVELHHD